MASKGTVGKSDNEEHGWPCVHQARQAALIVGVGDSFAPFTLRAHALDPTARMHILTSLKQLKCSFPTCVDGRVILLFRQNNMEWKMMTTLPQ